VESSEGSQKNSPTNPTILRQPVGTYSNPAYTNNNNNNSITSGGGTERDYDPFAPPEGSSMIQQLIYQAKLKVKLEEACKILQSQSRVSKTFCLETPALEALGFTEYQKEKLLRMFLNMPSTSHPSQQSSAVLVNPKLGDRL
jgi:hypothetical protein